MKIDFVSDVVCPWCAIGLQSLDQAIARLGDAVAVELRFQPFQLNPEMPPEGQDLVEYMAAKYGRTAEQTHQAQEMIRERGQALGYHFRMDRRTRTYNTFDAHRLLYWAGLEGQPAAAQRTLKRALLDAYFIGGENPGAHEVLLRAAGEAGLDLQQAGAILAGDTYAAQVRERQAFYHAQGVHAVPSVIVNDRHLIQGGQPPEVFEQALRQLAG